MRSQPPRPPRLLALAMALLLLPLCMSCAGSNSPPPRVEVLPVPDAYTTCAAEPLAPDLTGGPGDDLLTATFLSSLRAAGQDCRDKVQSVRDWSASIATPPK
jgi:hypothetical protein